MTAFQTETTQAYVVKDKDSSFELQTVNLPPVGPTDVKVSMICSGLCHTDVHMQKNDWGVTDYPCILGHEGVGRITEVGNAVKGKEVGQMVGVGWISGSCESCDHCVRGEENICRKGYQGTYLGERKMCGTFAKELVLPARFAFVVPEKIPATIAAPLLCAGITVYSPLRKWVKVNDKVGIISVGGLGHLAIQFARALGAEVTVYSTSKRKEADAKRFGATNFVVFTDAEELAKHNGTMDVILNTCPYTVPLEGFVANLSVDGVFVYLGLPESGESDLKVNLYSLVFGQKTLAGSIVGGSYYMKEMFAMVEKFGIKSAVTPVEYASINDSCDRLIKGDMNGSYRFSLCWDNVEEHKAEVKAFFDEQ